MARIGKIIISDHARAVVYEFRKDALYFSNITSRDYDFLRTQLKTAIRCVLELNTRDSMGIILHSAEANPSSQVITCMATPENSGVVISH